MNNPLAQNPQSKAPVEAIGTYTLIFLIKPFLKALEDDLETFYLRCPQRGHKII